MAKAKSYNIWLESAYQFFADEGLENFSVTALAKKCGLPRTNFYYYFQDKEEIIKAIIELHFQTTTEYFNVDLEKRFESLVPDLYKTIVDYKLGIQFAKQLFKNREIPYFNDAYKKGMALSADLIVPKFKEFINVDLPDERVKELWFTISDSWYSRIKFDDFTVESLSALAFEIRDSITPLLDITNTE
jgi:AcrR family transcriptional regulator